MINVFTLTKNHIFFSSVEDIFREHGIVFSKHTTNPQTAIAEFLECTPTPSVLLLSANWRFHDVKASELIKAFRALPEPPKIILVTNSHEPKLIAEFAPLHPDGYLFQSVGRIDILTNCIKQVHEGETVFCS